MRISELCDDFRRGCSARDFYNAPRWEISRWGERGAIADDNEYREHKRDDPWDMPLKEIHAR